MTYENRARNCDQDANYPDSLLESFESYDDFIPNFMKKIQSEGRCSFSASTDCMTSSWRVMSFFFVVFVLPTLLISVPLYARYHLYPTLHFWATDGDIMSLHSTVSSFWCQGQKVMVNGSFEAFQIREAVPSQKRVRRKMPLESTIFLQHDDAEEWGFYLVKGSTFAFSVCARWPGGSLVVVKGKENLRRCFYHENDLSEELRERQVQNGGAGIQQNNTTSDKHTTPVTSRDENHAGEIIDDSDPSLVNSELIDSMVTSRTTIPGAVSKLSGLKSAKNELGVTKEKNTKSKLTSSTGRHPSLKNLPLGIFTINETLDVFVGNSSFSSSEEYLRQCTNTIASIDLTPYVDCHEKVHLSRYSDIRWKFTVNESDFYYFIFSSDNNIETNVIHFNLVMHKTVYNVTEANSRCIDSKECFFAFPFLSSTGVILDVKGNYTTMKNLKDFNNYEVVSVCQPRFLVYTVLIILVPFIIVLFAFR